MKTGGGPAPEHPTCQGTPPRAGLNSPDHDQAPSLGEALAAYELLLDNVLTARRYWAGERVEHEGVRVWGSIVERAAARAKEQQRGT